MIAAVQAAASVIGGCRSLAQADGHRVSAASHGPVGVTSPSIVTARSRRVPARRRPAVTVTAGPGDS